MGRLRKSRQIGVISGIVGIVLTAWNVMNFINKGVGNPKLIYYIILLSISVIFVFLSFLENVNRWYQFISLIIMSSIFLLDNPENVYGSILLLLSLLFGAHNGLFKKNKRVKVIALTIYNVFIIMVSLVLKPDSEHIISLSIFYIFCIAIVFIIYNNGLLFSNQKEKEMKKKIKALEASLDAQMNLYSHIKTDFVNPVDAGLTEAELLVLEALCTYKESNYELGHRLDKSPNTVKVQITRILNKIGADDRHQLVDLCKNYFIFGDTKSVC